MTQREGPKAPYEKSGPIREGLARRNERLAHNNTVEQGMGTWGMYATSMSEYYSYFGACFHPETEMMPDIVEEWKKRTGKAAVVVDVAGLAKGSDIGADYTINVALNNPLGRRAEQGEGEIILGDITATAVQNQILAAVDKAPSRPVLIFFRPGAGFYPNKNAPKNSFVDIRLTKLLQNLYQKLDEEGEMYIDLFYWPKEVHQELKKYLEDTHIPHETPPKDRWGHKMIYRVYKENAGA